MLRNPIYIGTTYLEKRKTVNAKLVQTTGGVKYRRDRDWRTQQEPDAWYVAGAFTAAELRAYRAEVATRRRAGSFTPITKARHAGTSSPAHADRGHNPSGPA
jgi:hypothetical protein